MFVCSTTFCTYKKTLNTEGKKAQLKIFDIAALKKIGTLSLPRPANHHIERGKIPSVCFGQEEEAHGRTHEIREAKKYIVLSKNVRGAAHAQREGGTSNMVHHTLAAGPAAR